MPPWVRRVDEVVGVDPRFLDQQEVVVLLGMEMKQYRLSPVTVEWTIGFCQRSGLKIR